MSFSSTVKLTEDGEFSSEGTCTVHDVSGMVFANSRETIKKNNIKCSIKTKEASMRP
jgi:hypothetical protein